MNDVLAVQFSPYGTLHFLQCEPTFDAQVGDRVLYPTDQGAAVAHVAWRGRISDVSALPVCSRRADSGDDEDAMRTRRRIAQVHATAADLIADLGLNMRVLACDLESDDTGEVAVVYFQAPGRVDFRKLVAELARALGSRVDLRQLPSRDAAAVVSDVGRCGRPTCCTTWLADYGALKRRGKVTDANAGACGRVACCMSFEDKKS